MIEGRLVSIATGQQRRARGLASRARVRQEPTAKRTGKPEERLTEGGAGDWRIKTSSSRTDSWIRTPISWSANLVHWVGVSWMPSLRSVKSRFGRVAEVSARPRKRRISEGRPTCRRPPWPSPGASCLQTRWPASSVSKTRTADVLSGGSSRSVGWVARRRARWSPSQEASELACSLPADLRLSAGETNRSKA